MLKSLIALVGMCLSLVTMTQVQAAPIASFTLTSPQTKLLAPFAVGHAFKQGDIPSGSTVVASISHFQATVKTRWPDGSVQFALLAGRADLQANVPLKIDLISGTSSASGALLTETDLANQGTNALISFQGIGSAQLSNLIGQTGSFDSSRQQWRAGKVMDWIQGPEMSSWIYSSPMGSDPSLSAWFEVRFWQGGDVEILPWIENGYLLKTGITQKVGTASVTISGTSRFSQSLTVLNHTRTVLCSGTTFSYWLGADPKVTPRHDTAYLQKSKLVPTYGVQTPSSSGLFSQLSTSFTPFAQSNFPDVIGMAGYSSSIGLLPEWDAAFLTSGADPRALTAVVINAYAAGRYGIHLRDEKTNRPLRYSSYPNLVLDGGGLGVTDTGSSTTNSYTPGVSGGVPPYWKTSHAPSVGFMAYLTLGRFYFMEQSQFAATLVFLKQNDNSRKFTQGIFETRAGANTTRGAAWALRTQLHALLVTPDSDPLKSEFSNTINNNINYYYGRYIAQTNDPQGFAQPYSDYTPGDNIYMHAIWMEDFLTAAFGYILDAKVPSSTVMPNATAFFNWKARSIVGRLGNPGVSTEYDFRDAAQYNLPVAPSDSANWDSGVGPWYADWGQLYRVTMGANAGTAPANTLRGAYFPDPTSYWGNLQPAIAYAVTLNAPGAAQAYSRMTGASNWSSFVSAASSTPEWMIVPGASSGGGGSPSTPPTAPSNVSVE